MHEQENDIGFVDKYLMKGYSDEERQEFREWESCLTRHHPEQIAYRCRTHPQAAAEERL